MREMTQSPQTPEFQVGMTVKLRDDLPKKMYRILSPNFNSGEVYKVVALHTIRDEGGKGKDSVIAWLGPMNISDEEILGFEQKLERDEIPRNVFPLAVSHLCRALGLTNTNKLSHQ